MMKMKRTWNAMQMETGSLGRILYDLASSVAPERLCGRRRERGGSAERNADAHSKFARVIRNSPPRRANYVVANPPTRRRGER